MNREKKEKKKKEKEEEKNIEAWFHDLKYLIADSFVSYQQLSVIDKEMHEKEFILEEGFFAFFTYQQWFMLNIQLAKIFSKTGTQKRNIITLFDKIIKGEFSEQIKKLLTTRDSENNDEDKELFEEFKELLITSKHENKITHDEPLFGEINRLLAFYYYKNKPTSHEISFDEFKELHDEFEECTTGYRKIKTCEEFIENIKKLKEEFFFEEESFLEKASTKAAYQKVQKAIEEIVITRNKDSAHADIGNVAITTAKNVPSLEEIKMLIDIGNATITTIENFPTIEEINIFIKATIGKAIEKVVELRDKVYAHTDIYSARATVTAPTMRELDILIYVAACLYNQSRRALYDTHTDFTKIMNGLTIDQVIEIIDESRKDKESPQEKDKIIEELSRKSEEARKALQEKDKTIEELSREREEARKALQEKDKTIEEPKRSLEEK